MTSTKRPKDAQPDRPHEPTDDPASLGKPRTHKAGKQPVQKRTVGNRPADPNRAGADWNLLPPGISDEDVRDPGGMREDAEKPRSGKK